MKRTAAKTLEKGSALLEAVFTVPLCVAVILGIVQYALFAHATGLAHQAATAAVSEARRDGGTPEAGRRSAQDFLDSSTGLLKAPSVTVTRGATTATATVTGTVWTFLPWAQDGLPVKEQVTAAVERWVPR